LLAFGFPLPPALRHLEGAEKEKGVVQEIVEEVDEKPTEKQDDEEVEENSNGGISGGAAAPNERSSSSSSSSSKNNNKYAQWRGVADVWTEGYEAYLDQQEGGVEVEVDKVVRGVMVEEVDFEEDTFEHEEEEGWWSAKRSCSPTTQQATGVARVRVGGGGGCGGDSGSTSGSSSKNKTKVEDRGTGPGPYWCNLCGCPVASNASLGPHQKQCSRKLAATSAQCPTCHWPVG